MKKDSTSENDSGDFDAMKKLGFEFGAPQDGFSFQPDSSGTANGKIGKQEYGIDVDPDAETRDAESAGATSNIEDPSIAIAGNTNWTEQPIIIEEVLSNAPTEVKDEDLSALVENRLVRHPRLSRTKIAVGVTRGWVTLRGNVPSEAAKILAREIVESLPGVTQISNELHVM